MTDDAISQEVDQYAQSVRDALADIPAAQRDDLLEDLEGHLAEIAAESGEPLVDRIGTPADYAGELRAAYGANHETARPVGSALGDLARTGWARLTASRTGQQARVLATEFRPAWWLLRGYLAVLVVIAAVRGIESVRLVPNPTTTRGLLQILLTILAVAVSVYVGRRSRKVGSRTVGVLVAADLLLLVLAAPLMHYAAHGGGWPGGYPMPPPLYPGAVSGYAQAPLLNIYPYTRDGKPLADVLLYDQDGNPLNVESGKGFALVTAYPLDASGQPITNAYPLQVTQPDGQPQPRPRVALPPASPAPAASLTPSATPSVSR